MNRHSSDSNDDPIAELSGPPPDSPQSAWAGGWVAPIGLIAYGVVCCIRQNGWLWGNEGRWRLIGPEAVLLGYSFIAAGAFCHFHFFWGRHERTAWFSDLGKILSLLVFIVSVWRMTYLVFFG